MKLYINYQYVYHLIISESKGNKRDVNLNMNVILEDDEGKKLT